MRGNSGMHCEMDVCGFFYGMGIKYKGMWCNIRKHVWYDMYVWCVMEIKFFAMP